MSDLDDDSTEPGFEGMQLDLQKQYSLEELMEAGKGIRTSDMDDDFDNLDLDLDDLDLDDEAFVLSEEDETLLQVEAEPTELSLPEAEAETDSTALHSEPEDDDLLLPETEGLEGEGSELLDDLEIPDHTLEIHLSPEQATAGFELEVAPLPAIEQEALLVAEDAFAIEEDLQHFTPAEAVYPEYPVTPGYEDERLKLNATLRQQLELVVEQKELQLHQPDDIQQLNQYCQDLFSQTLQPCMHRLTKVWQAEEQILQLYHQLELASRQRGSVEHIISTAQQIAVTQEVADTEMLKKEEARQVLEKIKNTQAILGAYEQLLDKLV